MRRKVDRRRLWRLVEESDRKHRSYDAAVHVEQPRLRNGSDALPIRCLIESVCRGIRALDGSPIRHHPARKTPIALQDVVQEVIVPAGVGAVDAIIGAHHRAGTSTLECDLKREEIALPHRCFADVGGEHRSAGLLIVERVVLYGRDDVLVLHAADHGAGERSCEQRIFAKVLEVAAVPRVARKIQSRPQKHVEALPPCLVADRGAVTIGELRIPTGRQRERGRHRRRDLAAPRAVCVRDAETRVGLLQRRDAESRYSGHVSGGAERARPNVVANRHARFSTHELRNRSSGVIADTICAALASAVAALKSAEQSAAARITVTRSRGTADLPMRRARPVRVPRFPNRPSLAPDENRTLVERDRRDVALKDPEP